MRKQRTIAWDAVATTGHTLPARVTYIAEYLDWLAARLVEGNAREARREALKRIREMTSSIRILRPQKRTSLLSARKGLSKEAQERLEDLVRAGSVSNPFTKPLQQRNEVAVLLPRNLGIRKGELSPQPNEVLEKVRPPYGGKWPRIPSKKTIDALEESLKVGDQEAWGACRIIFSVMDDDFGRYVIGTNSWSTDFLAIRLDEPQWRSYSERLDEFRTDCDSSLSPLWDAYDAAESKMSHASLLKMFGELGPLRSKDALDNPNVEDFQPVMDEANAMLAKAVKALLGGLSPEQVTQLQDLWKLRRSQDATHAPKFDLHLIQRYVAKRVFALGWTIERFGAVRISGACTIKGGTLKGFVKFRKDDHFEEGKVAMPVGEKRWT